MVAQIRDVQYTKKVLYYVVNTVSHLFVVSIMKTKGLLDHLPRGHLLALSTAGLLMGTGLVLNTPDSTASIASRSTHQLVSPPANGHSLAMLDTTGSPQAAQPEAAFVKHAGATVPTGAASIEASIVPLAAVESATTRVGQTVGSLATETRDVMAATESPTPTTMTIQDSSTPLQWREFEVRKGDSLSSLFQRAGFNTSQLAEIDNHVKDKAWTRLFPGEVVAFASGPAGQLQAIKLEKSQLESWWIQRDDQERFQLEKVKRPTETRTVYTEGVINSVFYTAAQQAGLSDRQAMELATLFAWDVDFALDIRQGDSFKVIYEEILLDGKRIETGNIIAAQFTNQGETHTAVRFQHADGRHQYYDLEGNSLKKAFLRTPIDFARISSHFSLARKHPVLHKFRAHRGTDYAAAPGTPIKSTGDGKVVFAGKKGGYGNVIILQHGQGVTTLYAHMKSFARGMSVGRRVDQGQVIGYVGSTGLASGPHLHYEFRVHGVHKNPVTVKLPNAEPVPKAELAAFRQLSRDVVAQLEQHARSYELALQSGNGAQSSL